MKLELIVEKDIFKIQEKGESDKKFYEAAIRDLKDVKKEGDIIYSDCIYHLSRKSWITSEVLYKLATVIKKEHPDVAFNWFETFYDVEKNLYQKNIAEIDISDERKAKSLFENVLKNLNRFRKDTLSKDAEKHLEEIVNERINFYKL